MSAACPQFGFIIQVPRLSGTHVDELVRSFRAELLAARGLVVALCGTQLIVTGDGLQATNDDRDAVVAWLAERRDVEQYFVSPLGDVSEAA
jgi:uncharacterized protein YggL (DUF469 family)